ncbi:MAG: cytochrome c biogenesis CcdA family protein [Vulcanimicrobiaceae bacterium]
MFDPVAIGMRAIAAHAAVAPAFVLLCGLASSLGPCVASRFVAVAGLAANLDRRSALGTAVAFVAGLTAAYTCFGVAFSLLGRLASLSHAIYWCVAAALCVGGVATIWREKPACSHAGERRGVSPSLGGAFLLGAACAFVVSPCCTPLLVGILAYTSEAGDPLYGALLLGLFAVGHAAPVIAAGLGASAAGSFLKRYAMTQAAAVVAGALMLALAGYYAVLA